jgi:murein DD-endopeptidase MepM/ murein hydrolase activator NlpD
MIRPHPETREDATALANRSKRPHTEGFMSFRNLRRFVVLALVAAAGGWLYYSGLSVVDLAHLLNGSPHQRYTVELKYRGVANTEAGRRWIEAAEQSLIVAKAITLPLEAELADAADNGRAVAYAVTLRRGQRYVIDAAVGASHGVGATFVDVFERDDARLRHIGNAVGGATALALEIRADGEYLVRVQRALDHEAPVRLALRVEPTLRLPVERMKRASIQSFFGDSRDGGRRRHHGVDIFARRGTPVIAAADGIVSSVGRNGLGGNVVWVARPGHRELHYYAHLEQQLVKPGTLVKAGDVLGTVGNTGNAQRTAPHLHFGIYAAGGPVDPLPYIVSLRG